ncbi:MAG: prolyl oligopeptidase family serine peptidase, partial [Rhodothermales bacterium]
TKVGHPELQAWKYPLPEDSVIFRISRVVIHVDEPRVVRFQMPPDPHRGTTRDHIAGRDGRFDDVEWSEDSSQLAFVSSSRDHKEAKLRVADIETGAVRDVMEEVVDTYFESGVRMVNWHVLFETNEVIWFSERDNWGHLYLYDLQSGGLKHRITSGNWAVQQLRRIDKENRTLYFTAGGREEGDPYFQNFYRINMDGTDLRLLTPEKANHSIMLSPSGRYFVDSYSTPVVPPVTVLRDTEGRVVVELEEADISQLVAEGWQPPTPITVKARDGETDIYGLMYKPTTFDPSKSYPILNYLYPGPQSGSVGSRSFRPSRSDKQAVAELGFIVVEVDAMGTPGRSKSFHDAYYGNMGDNGIPDQIAAIKQLAARNPWMDLDRVGIWGHSGGGFASADAILRYPDFYKVAVSGAGNHDNRNYEDDWGEKWQGLLETYPDGTTNYDNQSNHLLAKNLKGKLLIAHGMMDSNVPPSNTLLLVDALIAANKDFDLLMIPNGGHGFGGARTYWMRRRWDYFVRHLIGVEPPKEYEFGKRRVRIAQPTG